MHDIFNDDNMEGILLKDPENAFNSINRKVMLHNLKFICPVIAIYVSKCYMCHARFFIISGGELISKEGTKQGEPTSMRTYALGILPLLQFLLNFISVNELNAKEVAFVDGYLRMVTGELSSIKDY